MTMFRKVPPLALAALLASCAANEGLPPPPTAAAEMSPAITLDNVRAVARQYIEAGTVANMVVGVSLPDGSEVWLDEGTLAFDSDTPADDQSLYRIYSMTKPITGVAAAILIEEGKLGLDQPVCDFYEAFCDQQVLVDKDVYGETRAAAGPLTIRHLLTHTGGLGYNIIPSALQEPYAKAGITPGSRRPSPIVPGGPQPNSLEEFADRVGNMPLRVDPGTEWHYNVGLDVLGAVIEKASGMPFDQFLQTRVFQPLGMDDTTFVVAQEDLGRLTTNYFMMNGATTPIDTPADSEYAEQPPFPAGGAGLASTAEDYLRFAEAMANEGRVDGRQALPKSVVDFATSNLMPEGVCFSSFMAEGQCQGFGAGGRVVLDTAGGEPLGTYGWGGAASTLASAMPNEDVAYVMMTQLLFNQTELQADFARALRQDLAPVLSAEEM